MGDGPTPAGRKRLADRVRARRARLRLPIDLSTHGGPAEMTVRRIELGETTSIRPKTKSRLEHALQWPPGHVDDILDGTATEPPPARPDPVPSRDDIDITGIDSPLTLRNHAMWRAYCFGARQIDLAAQYGLSQQHVSDILAAVRATIPDEDKEDRLRRYTAQLDWMGTELALLAQADPIPAYSNGRPILMADGETIADDHSGRVTAMRELRSVQERAAKMLGLDAAMKVQSAHSFEVTPELEERLKAARAALQDDES